MTSMAAITLLRIPPRAGALGVILAMWRLMAGLCLSVAFGRLFGGMLEVQSEGVVEGWGAWERKAQPSYDPNC